MSQKTSYMFVTGPKVAKTVTGEDISTENLGGANVHATKSGVAHFTVKEEEEGLMLIRKLLSYMPQNNMEEPQKPSVMIPLIVKKMILMILFPKVQISLMILRMS